MTVENHNVNPYPCILLNLLANNEADFFVLSILINLS